MNHAFVEASRRKQDSCARMQSIAKPGDGKDNISREPKRGLDTKKNALVTCNLHESEDAKFQKELKVVEDIMAQSLKAKNIQYGDSEKKSQPLKKLSQTNPGKAEKKTHSSKKISQTNQPYQIKKESKPSKKSRQANPHTAEKERPSSQKRRRIHTENDIIDTLVANELLDTIYLNAITESA